MFITDKSPFDNYSFDPTYISYKYTLLGDTLPSTDGEDGWSNSFDVPGYDKKDITIEVNDKKLIITADNEERGKRSRILHFDDSADLENVLATLKNGVLTIKVKKKPEKQKKKIEIKVVD